LAHGIPLELTGRGRIFIRNKAGGADEKALTLSPI
jgi:hypothetical protein